MADGRRPVFASPTASLAAGEAPLGDEARALLANDPAPAPYLNALAARGLFADAVQFLAHALPKREAVWWACLCSREAQGASISAEAEAALRAAERWAAGPDEPSRRAAEAAAALAGVGTPAGCAATAAFWSEGSLAPPHVQDVPPPLYLTARGVAGSVLLAAVATEPERAGERFRRFLALGLDVASAANLWQAIAPIRPPSPSSPVSSPAPLAPRPIQRPIRRPDQWES